MHMRSFKKLLPLLGAALLLSVMGSCASQEESKTESNARSGEGTASMQKMDVLKTMTQETGVTINYINQINDTTIETMKDAGITYARVVVTYPFTADGQTVTSHYTAVCRTIKKLHAAGIKVMAQSIWPGGMGYSSATKSITWISQLPEVYENFDDSYFYKIVYNAYAFAAEDLRDYVDLWLVSNEPDIKTYTGAMSIDQIVKYIEESAKGIKKGNPNAKCGVNFLGTEWTDYTMLIAEKLYGDASVLDYVGLDAYFGSLQPGGPETWTAYINEFYEKLKLPIIITEWSYSSAATDPANTFKHAWGNHVRGEETQADYIREALPIFRSHPQVLGSFWYALSDSDDVDWESGNPDSRLYSSWGLLDTRNNPKLSMRAIREVVREGGN